MGNEVIGFVRITQEGCSWRYCFRANSSRQQYRRCSVEFKCQKMTWEPKHIVIDVLHFSTLRVVSASIVALRYDIIL